MKLSTIIVSALLSGSVLLLYGCSAGNKGDADSADMIADSSEPDTVAEAAVDTLALKEDADKFVNDLYYNPDYFYYDGESKIFHKCGTAEFSELIDKNIRKAKNALNGIEKNQVRGNPESLLIGDLLPDVGTDGSEDARFNKITVSDISVSPDGKNAIVTLTAHGSFYQLLDEETYEELNKPKLVERLSQNVTLHLVNESENVTDPDWKVDDISMPKYGSLKTRLEKDKLYFAGFAP